MRVQERTVAPQDEISLTEGDSFGEAALLSGEPRNATVVAASDVELYTLDAASFKTAVDSSSTFAEQLRDVFFQRQ